MTVQFARMSRQALYDLVWSEPMTKVAARYSLSDVGLKKICIKHRIPVPHRGYWQQVEVGKAVRKVALPKTRDEAEVVIRIVPKGDVTSSRLVMYEPAYDAEATFPAVFVPPALERPHAVTKVLQQALKHNPDEYGAVWSRKPDAFLVRVHPSSVDRALRIIDTVAKACAERGFQFRPGKPDSQYDGQLPSSSTSSPSPSASTNA